MSCKIECHLARDIFRSNELASFLLKPNNSNSIHNVSLPSITNSCILYVQALGFINVDFRWLKINTPKLSDYFSSPDHFSVLDKWSIKLSTTPVDPTISSTGSTSTCIFTTSCIPISPSLILNEEGAIIQLTLPPDLLPTFRGLSASINYYLIINVQESNSMKSFHFPFHVTSSNSQCNAPFEMKYSSIVAFSVASLPLESYLSSGSSPITSDYSSYLSSNYNHVSPQDNIYNIRDTGYICSLRLSGTNIIIGQDLQCILDFSKSTQPCYAIQLSLIISEVRKSDLSRIQDKTIQKIVRSTIDAQQIHLSFHISKDHPGSFQTLLFQVLYRLDVEFCLTDSSDIQSTSASYFEDALSFSIPLQLLPHPSRMNASSTVSFKASEELEDTASSVHSFTWSHLSIQSNRLSVPILQGDNS